MARIAAASAVVLVALLHVTMGVTVQEFFKDAKPPQIKWAHAVNSKAKLHEALNASSGIHMIEADVNIGRLNSETDLNKTYPIMAHDANTTSDLSLKDFLNLVVTNKTRGIKLDFKTSEALTQSVSIINSQANLTSIPVWINADIMTGPGGKAPGVTSEVFYQQAKLLSNETLLSVGWTTGIKPSQNFTTESYSAKDISDMVNGVRDAKIGSQSVTYPVRAAIAANSVEHLAGLLNNNQTKLNNPTLTIWSAAEDKVNVTGLQELINAVGAANLYVDVPADLAKDLNLNGAFSIQSSIAVLLATLVAALHL